MIIVVFVGCSGEGDQFAPLTIREVSEAAKLAHYAIQMKLRALAAL